MGVGPILRTLGRRWYLVLFGLVLSGALGYAGYVFSPPQYEARGTVLLLPSKDQMSTGGRNPFLQLNNLDSIAGIVIARLAGDNAVAAFEESYPRAEYTVQPDLTMRGPTIQVVVTDETEPGALRLLQLLLDDAERTLGEVQAEQKVPKPALVGSMRLVVDDAAEQKTETTLRTATAAGGAGILASALMVFAIDGLLLRRRHNKQDRAARQDRPTTAAKPGEDQTGAAQVPQEQSAGLVPVAEEGSPAPGPEEPSSPSARTSPSEPAVTPQPTAESEHQASESAEVPPEIGSEPATRRGAGETAEATADATGEAAEPTADPGTKPVPPAAEPDSEREESLPDRNASELASTLRA